MINTMDKEMTVKVTEKEYREELAKGFTDDEVLKPGRYKVERSPWAEKLRAAVENDILNNEEFLRALKEKLETI